MTPEGCRERASQCVALAKTMRYSANKVVLLSIARKWLKLARRLEEPTILPVSISDLPDDRDLPPSVV